MTQYFYNQNDERKGPINLEELKKLISEKEIKSETLIWSEGFEDWKKISEISEFKGLFLIPPPISKEPPPITNQSKKVEEKKPKKKRRGRFLLWLIPLLIIGGIAGSYFYQQEQRDSEQRYERINPERHLRVDNTNTKVNLLLDNVVKGTISNTSRNTTYGEIVLELRWYTKKDKLISKKQFTINKNIRPYGSTEFKIKDTAPLRARTYYVEVVDAEVINQY